MPELYPDLFWVWEFFDLLNRQRQIGMAGPQPISLIDILAATSLKCLNREEVKFITRVIPQMDSVFLNDYYSKQEKSRNKNKNKGKVK